jgi:hypothetical protein
MKLSQLLLLLKVGKISVPVGDKIFRVGSPSPGEQTKIDYRLKVTVFSPGAMLTI